MSKEKPKLGDNGPAVKKALQAVRVFARCPTPSCDFEFTDEPMVLKDNRHAYGFCEECKKPKKKTITRGQKTIARKHRRFYDGQLPE